MKIISWNCRYGEFHTKAKDAAILPLQPDVLIVSECDHLGCQSPETMSNLNGSHWIGRVSESFSIGLGVFTFGDYRLDVLDCFDPEIQWIVPYKITADRTELILIAVWTIRRDAVLEQRGFKETDWIGHQEEICYVERTWKALQRYDYLLAEENVLIMGDFNSTGKKLSTRQSVKIDDLRIDHAKIVEFLGIRDIRSVYHVESSQMHGNENQATYYHYGKQNQSYHIDFCFVSDAMMKKLKDFKIGAYESWKKFSDHMPIIAEFEM